MASIKVKFRPSSVAGREGTLYYRVIHDGVPRQISTGYKLYPSEWDTDEPAVILPGSIDNSSDDRREYLLSLRTALTKDLARLKNIVARLENGDRPYTTDRVIELYSTLLNNGGFIAFARQLIRELQQTGKRCTAETYTTTLNSFVRFRGEQDIPLEEVNSHLMVEYETYLKSTGICPNTSSYYMRNLRAIYNCSVEKELTVQRYPFRHVYTGIDKTAKRAVPLEIIRRIKDLDLTQEPFMDYARDLFMFSFYTRGMSFIDMAYLKKRDLQDGILSYRRRKTNRQLFVKWERPMQELVSKYDTSGTPYLLPIIRDVRQDGRRQYQNVAHQVNARLKKLGTRIGLALPLTSYVARHSWASIAMSRNIPVTTISEAMGHDSEKTTRIYLASLDKSAVDKANNRILNIL